MADTPVLDLTGRIGRVNTGGGMAFSEITSGSAYTPQYDNSLITTLAFKPLLIVTFVGSMYVEGIHYTGGSVHISYRKGVRDAFTTWQQRASGDRYHWHAYVESSGELRAYFSQHSRETTVYYLVLGV